MHSKKVVHRDLKLQNILIQAVDNFLEIKLADFGFATNQNIDRLNS